MAGKERKEPGKEGSIYGRAQALLLAVLWYRMVPGMDPDFLNAKPVLQPSQPHLPSSGKIKVYGGITPNINHP